MRVSDLAHPNELSDLNFLRKSELIIGCDDEERINSTADTYRVVDGLCEKTDCANQNDDTIL